MATTRNKVMWQEGMLMRPHHFQQQQRYNDYPDNQRFRAMNNLSRDLPNSLSTMNCWHRVRS